MSILIVGNQGFLGSKLWQIAQAQDFDVIAYDGRTPDGPISAIINCAGVIDPKICETDKPKAYAGNVALVRELQKFAQEKRARLVHISSASVFPCDAGPYTIHDLPNPKNYYSLTKYVSEEILVGDPNAVTVRMTMIGIHPLGRRMTFFEYLVNDLKAGKTIQAFDDVMMNPVSTQTASEFLLELAQEGFPAPLLHIGSKDIWSKYQIAKAVAKHLGLPTERVQSDSMPDDGIPKPKRMLLDITETERLLGRPMPDLATEIEKALGLM